MIRAIGGTVFLFYAFYLFLVLKKVLRTPFEIHFRGAWLSAVAGPAFGFILFGLPGLYLALRGLFSRRAGVASANSGKPSREERSHSKAVPGVNPL